MSNSQLIECRLEGKIAIVTMNDGTDACKNSHNLNFANQLLDTLTELKKQDIKSLILSSASTKNWSQGIDVAWFLSNIQQQQFEPLQTFLGTMDKVLESLLTYPVPVIAAINGHTFGNGCVLAAACDFRLMRSDRGFVCFPEVDLGIPFVPGLVPVLTKAFTEKTFYKMILTGNNYTASEMLKEHFIDEVCDSAAQLEQRALEFAASFNKKRAIFIDHKMKMNSHIIEEMKEKNQPAIANKQFFLS